ncbi:TPA: hypothetical protein QCZ17_003015 [Bacillus cereus]|nr:hypothetical protein [Bacillus cereus]
MSTLNYCENSVFLKEDEKKILNKKLNTFFKEISDELQYRRLDINLYVGGSLARKEPSITYANNSLKLHSDIDFILVYKNCTEMELKEFTDWAINYNPEMNSTFQVLPYNNLPYITGCFAYDFLKLAENPIFQSFEVQLPTPNLTKRFLIENIIHQFSGFFLYPHNEKNINKAIFRAEHKYHKIKVVLESLRSQLFLLNNFENNYKNIYEHRNTSPLNELIAEQSLLNIIKSREYYNSNEQSFSSIDITNLLASCLKNLIVKDEIYIENNLQLFNELKQYVSQRENNVLDAFYYSSINLIIILNLKDYTYLDAYIELFTTLIKEYGQNNPKYMSLYSHTKVREYILKDQTNELFSLFRKLHEEYLSQLAQRNSGYLKEISL